MPPDVNRSAADFTVRRRQDCLRPGRHQRLRRRGGRAIAQARKAGGPFRSLFDFCERCDPSVVNRTAIESLIKAGAFDQLHANRAVAVAVARSGPASRRRRTGRSARGPKRPVRRRCGRRIDQRGRSHRSCTSPIGPTKSGWPTKKKCSAFISPAIRWPSIANVLATHCSHTTTGLAGVPQRTEVTLGGMLSSIKFSQTKNPRQGSTNTKYAMFDLEDMDGIVRCIVWPEEFAQFGQLVQADAILAVRGAVDRRPGSDEANLIVNELIPLDELRRRGTKGIVVRVHEESHGIETLEKLRELIAEYPGKAELQLLLNLADGSRLYLKSDSLRVELNAELRERIEGLLGPGNLRAITAPAQSSPPPRAEYGSQRAMATST